MCVITSEWDHLFFPIYTEYTAIWFFNYIYMKTWHPELVMIHFYVSKLQLVC